jgi:hypothetical protein
MPPKPTAQVQQAANATASADSIITRIRGSRVLAPAFIVSAILGGLATFTDSASKVSGVLVKLYDPEKAHIRSVSRDQKAALSAFVSKYKDSRNLEMEYKAFISQDEGFVVEFMGIWNKAGFSMDELHGVERMYELDDYLLIKDHIPFRDPKTLVSNLPFLVEALSTQRKSALQDFNTRAIRGGDGNRLDEISYRMYAAALTAQPDMLAGDYARKTIEEMNTNYVKYADLIRFMNSLTWDIGYLPIEQFMVQNKAIAAEFRNMEQRLRQEIPLGDVGKNAFTAKERIEAYILYLDDLASK